MAVCAKNRPHNHIVDGITNAEAFIGKTKIDPSVERNIQKVQTHGMADKKRKNGNCCASLNIFATMYTSCLGNVSKL